MKLIKKWAAVLLLALSLAMLAWGFWPAGRQERELHIAPQEVLLPDGAPPLPQGLLLRLEWPERMRSGEAGDIRLSVELEAAQPVSEQTQVFYAGRRFAIEARLEMAEASYSPPGEVIQGLSVGQPAHFAWQAMAASGAYPGEVWSYLHLIPLDGGQSQRTVLAAQKIGLQVDSLFGLSSTTVRAAGSVGAVVGLVLLLDEWLWGRRGRRPGAVSEKVES